jgi:hypothetical protein
MLGLRRAQRALLVDKLAELAELAAAAMVFGQFVGNQRYSLTVAVFGVFAWCVLLGWALIISRQET